MMLKELRIVIKTEKEIPKIGQIIRVTRIEKNFNKVEYKFKITSIQNLDWSSKRRLAVNVRGYYIK